MFKKKLSVIVITCLALVGNVVTYADPSPASSPALGERSPFLLFGIMMVERTVIDFTVSYISTALKQKYPQYHEKRYQKVGMYDGGMRYGSLISLEQFKPYYAWWDTGLILTGSGVGCRQVLPGEWLNQSWFAGIYGYYDVMGNVGEDLTLLAMQYINGGSEDKEFIKKDLPYRLLYPLRLNIGLELGGSDWGQLTLNAYGMLIPDLKLSSPVREKGGISGRISLNLYPTLKPFLCGAVSWIEREHSILKDGFSWKSLLQKENFIPETVTSMAWGVRWSINPMMDIEVKYFLHDSHNYNMFMHVGYHVRLSPTKSADNFQGALHRPPERYIPYYPDALALHPVFSFIKSTVDGRVSQYKTALKESINSQKSR